MSGWHDYEARMKARGTTKRNAALRREKHWLSIKGRNSLSYHQVVIDGVDRNVEIINSDILDTKTIISMPDETLACGTYVEWEGFTWLITAKDFNREVYTKCTMRQCNYLLKWAVTVGGKQIVNSRWAIVEDGTKYLTGETMSSYNDNGMALGDTRITVTIPFDAETVKLGRRQRFVIDRPGTKEALAYRLTKPFKVGGNYNGEGVFTFVLDEVNLELNDDVENWVANYTSEKDEDNDGAKKEKEIVIGTGGVWL